MSRKKLKDPINKVVSFKLTTKEYNKLNGLAKLWTRGDRSEFIRMRIFEGKDYKTNREVKDLCQQRNT